MKGTKKIGLIKITTDNPEELFERPKMPLITPGKHLFVVAKLTMSIAASGNKVLKLEARCQDEDQNKGLPCFDNFVLIENPQTEDDKTTKRIHDSRLA